MDLLNDYGDWRRRHGPGWGLAWYLAAEVMERFYASHGIVAVEIEKEGLGYYGIMVRRLPCRRRREPTVLGRFTMAGDVGPPGPPALHPRGAHRLGQGAGPGDGPPA